MTESVPAEVEPPLHGADVESSAQVAEAFVDLPLRPWQSPCHGVDQDTLRSRTYQTNESQRSKGDRRRSIPATMFDKAEGQIGR
jgi:hypothetical protein